MKTFATMFSGFGGADVGLMAAGLRPLWGVEYDADIASVYRHNIGDHIIVDDVRRVDYSALPHVDWLHASPSCVRASVANVDATEAAEDIEAAQAVVRALRAHKPQVFTLENVWGYRNFTAFRLILDNIGNMGYFYDFEHVNSADMGVPQTRKRLILRAVYGALLPPLPMPVAWVGWYAAIEDLLPTLPESKLPKWVTQRIPSYLTYPSPEQWIIDTHAALVNGGNHVEDAIRFGHEPATTVTGNTFGRQRIVMRSGCVLMTSPRCLARFQSFPDSYELPDKRSLAAKGISNAVPSLLMQRIAEGVTA